MQYVVARKRKRIKVGTPMVQMNLLLSIGLDERLRAHAAARGVSMVSLIRALLEREYPTMPSDDVPEEVVLDRAVQSLAEEQVAGVDVPGVPDASASEPEAQG